ncbi:MAG: hypothetical protein ACRENK_04330 [Gemmatimonadaceae bacterium]
MNSIAHVLATVLFALLCWTSKSLAGGVPLGTFSIGSATVGVTTLTEILDAYGTAKASRISGEDEADISVCYVHSSPKGETFLVFESGVMGSFKVVTGFRVSVLRPKEHCVSTKIELGGLKTGNGIQLGLKLEDFKKALPVEFKHRDSRFIYRAVTKRVATHEELRKLRERWPNERQDYFDVTTTLIANFKQDRLVDLYVHRIESY